MNEWVGLGVLLLVMMMMVLSSIALVLSCFCFFFSSDGDEIEMQHELVVKCTQGTCFFFLRMKWNKANKKCYFFIAL